MRLVAALAALAALASTYQLGNAAARQAPRVYELRTYTTLPGRLPALHARFRDHTMRLFEKHGMRNEMYWVPTDSARRDNTMIYVLSHTSREAADASWRAFATDSAWIRVRNASEAAGPILARNPDRTWMVATDYSPPTQR
jgi:hypothetical protein